MCCLTAIDSNFARQHFATFFHIFHAKQRKLAKKDESNTTVVSFAFIFLGK